MAAILNVCLNVLMSLAKLIWLFLANVWSHDSENIKEWDCSWSSKGKLETVVGEKNRIQSAAADVDSSGCNDCPAEHALYSNLSVKEP